MNAALSPDGEWLAFRVRVRGAAWSSTYAYRQSQTERSCSFGAQRGLPLLAPQPGRPMAELLAFTAGTVDQPYRLPADVWVFDADVAEPTSRLLTTTAPSFAADFYGTAGDDDLLWVSVAGRDAELRIDRVAA